jgi:hypothetical protein
MIGTLLKSSRKFGPAGVPSRVRPRGIESRVTVLNVAESAARPIPVPWYIAL